MAGSPTDAELVALCRTGDDGAWALLVERYARYVNAILARAYRLEPHVAEDTFQDVFERVYEQLPKLRDDDAFRPWLAQLTRRLAIDALRTGAREQSYATISSALDIPPGTIASRISRCLGRLRKNLEGRSAAPASSGGR